MRKTGAVILLLAFFLACSAPKGAEQFLKGAGPWSFEVDMTDSLSTYDISFYTRRDCAPARRAQVAELPLTVEWVSPAADTLREVVYLPLSAKSTFYSSETSIPYRNGVAPASHGVWTLVVTPHDTVTVRGLRGLGLAVKRRK
ncbi:MAG: hypothetical protein IK045_03715 [Bacteroidales bacterium]|nr:hypothetical protein [Bacteroidales bacterium]